MNERRSSDERINQILESLNLLHLKIELITQTIEKEIKKDCVSHAKTLYDSENGICKIVQIDHERIMVLGKIIWAVSGAVVVLLINTIGKIILK